MSKIYIYGHNNANHNYEASMEIQEVSMFTWGQRRVKEYIIVFHGGKSTNDA